ncbi:T9SS type A sorting domain-containing protein [Galbibacter pacificus]|uniref:T9SS type A sorting domain-containing protein n=1 Tax=Galbibacter pacificus TaxID=2996052 RepID=A0ABT6FNE7_9FLAO|nr:T9SS type A sorting domain-containing protein [Galbibacter pacificus]MDG3581262.1 T9SS type A sorting domain-containing protein [Galbibacter pacificus]MDG3584740.1 T9SS type A sorting domain-containing protein [Galbibacter pacificus]
MKIKLLVMIFVCLTSYAIQAQSEEYKIKFSYDSAGNQILRDRVCVNCSSAKTTAPKKELVAETPEEEEKIEETDNRSMITAYPNPVTDLLNVMWVESENAVKQVAIYGTDGRLLFTQEINSKSGQLNMDFGRYPSGLYLLLVTYQDNHQETFKVIKK